MIDRYACLSSSADSAVRRFPPTHSNLATFGSPASRGTANDNCQPRRRTSFSTADAAASAARRGRGVGGGSNAIDNFDCSVPLCKPTEALCRAAGPPGAGSVRYAHLTVAEGDGGEWAEKSGFYGARPDRANYSPTLCTAVILYVVYMVSVLSAPRQARQWVIVYTCRVYSQPSRWTARHAAKLVARFQC